MQNPSFAQAFPLRIPSWGPVLIRFICPQASRSYYLFFYYLFFYYLYMFPEWSKSRGGMFPEWSKIGFANVPRMVVENSPNHTSLWKTNDLRVQGASRSGEAQRGPNRPAEVADGPLRAGKG